MNKEYIALEKELAELLGWTDVRQVAANLVGQDGIDWRQVPVWCSDDAAAFQLMIEHLVMIDIDGMEVTCGYGVQNRKDWCHEQYAGHLDKATAVRVAICKAVIAKLKESK